MVFLLFLFCYCFWYFTYMEGVFSLRKGQGHVPTQSSQMSWSDVYITFTYSIATGIVSQTPSWDHFCLLKIVTHLLHISAKPITSQCNSSTCHHIFVKLVMLCQWCVDESTKNGKWHGKCTFQQQSNIKYGPQVRVQSTPPWNYIHHFNLQNDTVGFIAKLLHHFALDCTDVLYQIN